MAPMHKIRATLAVCRLNGVLFLRVCLRVVLRFVVFFIESRWGMGLFVCANILKYMYLKWFYTDI